MDMPETAINTSQQSDTGRMPVERTLSDYPIGRTPIERTLSDYSTGRTPVEKDTSSTDMVPEYGPLRLVSTTLAYCFIGRMPAGKSTDLTSSITVKVRLEYGPSHSSFLRHVEP